MNNNYKEIAEFIQGTLSGLFGCKFVGIAEDGELFVAFAHDNIESTKAAIYILKEHFPPPKVTKITIVEQLDVQKATELIKELNEFIDKKKDPNLLDIGEF